MKTITVDELADFAHSSATRETLKIVKALGLGEEETSGITHRLFIELLAFYQYLALVYTANVTEPEVNWLNAFGGELTLAMERFAKGRKGRPAAGWVNIPEVLRSGMFHSLVKAYMAGDTSISGLSQEDWGAALHFTSFDKLSDNFMAMNEVTAFSRLLSMLGTPYDSADLETTISVWLSHRESARQAEAQLKEMFRQAFPERLL